MKNLSQNFFTFSFLFSVLLAIFIYSGTASAQITSTVTGNTNTTPNLQPTYPSLAAALTDLNLVSAMTGPVTFTLGAGTSETAPRTGFAIGSSTLNPVLNSTNTVTFVKAGGTVTINAGIGTAAPTSASPDGMLRLDGADYITIDGLKLTDGNITNPASMEFGIGLFKRNAGDGCNNNTIQNCTIDMQRINNSNGTLPMLPGSIGILIINSVHGAAITALTPTNGGTLASNGTNSANKIYANTINSGNGGIGFSGYAATVGVGPAPAADTFLGDLNNDIGGTTSGTGNLILNYGGGGSSNTAAGIRAGYQWSLNVSYNTLNNNNGGGINHTTTLKGIYFELATSANLTVNNNNVTVHGGSSITATVSGIENFFGSTPAGNTVNINNNAITGDYLTATSGSFYGILTAAGAENLFLINNNISNLVYSSSGLAGTGVCAGISISSAPTNFTIRLNTISNLSMTGTTGGPLVGITTSVASGNQNINSNNINNLSISGTGAAGNITGVQISGLTSVCDSNTMHTFTNSKSSGTGPISGIICSSIATSSDNSYNIIHTLSHAGTGNVSGILQSSAAAGVRTFSNNILHTISTGGISATGITIVNGTSNIFKNKIYGITSSNAVPSVLGITAGGVTSVNIYNNIIGELNAPNGSQAPSTPSIRGMTISTGTYNVYNNSVFINASSGGADFSTCALYIGTGNLTLNNNILVNNSISSGTGFAVSFQRNTTNVTQYLTASNNNLFYAGTPGADNLLYYDGTNAYQDMATLKFRLSPRESNSISENPDFMSITGSDANFLMPDSLTRTFIESGGITISSPAITKDYRDAARYPNSGYPNNLTYPALAPDIGAYEFGGIKNDITGPVITYTALGNSLVGTNQTLTATITDFRGVGTGIGLPVLYWNLNGGSYTALQGTSIGSDQYTFTFGSAAANPGDEIKYYIVAQDVITPTPNFSCFPSAGASGFTADPPAVSALPSTPSSFFSYNTMAGTFTVGSGGDYSNLKSAFDAINVSVLNGDVTLLILAGVINETECCQLNNISYVGGTRTITIKPDAGATALIQFATAVLPVLLNGADNVIIDGSNNGTTSRNLTIETTAGVPNNSVIWMQTASSGPDRAASNNIIKNCNIIGAGPVVTIFGIGSGGSGISLSSAGTNNNNNTFQNNSISRVQYGIYTSGASSGNKNTGTVITGNLLNPTGSNEIGSGGIYARFEDGISITKNTIGNISKSSGFFTGTAFGIALGLIPDNTVTSFTGSDVTNATVSGNIISGISNPHATGYSSFGIVMNQVSSGTSMVTNNSILGVLSPSTANNVSVGILIGAGSSSTTNCYYNSVYMSGNRGAGATYPSFCAVITANNTVNLMNNIFYNSQTTASTGKSYAIGTIGSTFTNLNSNYNNLYVSGGSGILGKTGGLFSGTDRTALSDWKTATSKDASSLSGNPGFTSATNLTINAASQNAWNVSGLGLPLSNVTLDILDNSRSGAVTNGATDLGAYNITPSSQPAAAIENAPPVISTTTSYVVNGNTLATLSWGAGGTPPTSMALQYYPGVNPPNSETFPIGNFYWVFTPSGGTGYTYDITFTYSEAQLGNIGSEDDIRLLKSDNGGTSYTPYSIAGSGPGEYELNTAANTIKVYGLTSFSLFGIGDVDQLLPVELSSFSANVNKRNVELKWSTVSEENNAGFDIERKTVSSQTWTKSGYVSGHGTTNTSHNYIFEDRNLETGKYNYRLKQIDNNGNFKYHQLTSLVEVGVPSKFALSQNYPNPFNPTTKINYDLPFDSKVSIKIFDMTGREVAMIVNLASQPAGYYTVQFNGANLASGVYFYNIIAEGGNAAKFITTKKMVLVK